MSDQLVAIDDALETGVADHHDPLTRELQELALALRADAPEADPDFERRLRGRVESGFKRPASSGRRPLWTRITTPALATSLVVLPLVLIAVLAGGSGQSGEDSLGGGGGSVVAESGDDDAGAAGGGAPESAGGGGAAEPADKALNRALAGAGGGLARLRRRLRLRGSAPGRRLRAWPAQSQDRALCRPGAGDARRPDGARGRAGHNRDEPARRVRAELVRLHRRGLRRRRLRAAHPLQPAASRPARPGCARRRAHADPDRPRRHARARDREGPPPGRARRAPQPAAPARAGHHRRGGGGDPPPARPGGGRDQRPALPAARPAAAHGLRRGHGEPAPQGRRPGRRRGRLLRRCARRRGRPARGRSRLDRAGARGGPAARADRAGGLARGRVVRRRQRESALA